MSDAEKSRVRQHREGIIAGDPERVRTQLTELAGAFDVDELVVVTVCHDPNARLRSYQLLAEVFGLSA